MSVLTTIQKAVKDKEWQKLRSSMIGTWTSKENIKNNIKKLKSYVSVAPTSANRLLRVHNYLNALRGVKHTGITQYRDAIRTVRKKLGYMS
jgi:hypothetical protein